MDCTFTQDFFTKSMYISKFIFIIISIISFKCLATDYYINDGSTTNDSFSGQAFDGSGDGSSGDPYNLLQDVFDNHDLGAGDNIYIDAGTYTESFISVGSNDEGFTIQGVSEALTIFNGGDVTTFFLEIENAGNDDITIKDLTIMNYGTTASNGNGKAILIGGAVSDKAITGIVISNVTFDDIDCRNTNSSYGGAIGHTSYAGSGSDLTLNNCTFLNNDAGSGACYTSAAGTGDVITINFNDCIFHTNSSAYRCAVYRAPNSSSSVTVNWNSCIFYNNTSARTLIFPYNQSHTITNCLFYENTVTDATEKGVFEAFSAVTYNIRNSTIVDNDGGGIYVANAGATTNIYSCIIQDNTSQNDIHEAADGTTNVFHTIYNTLSGDFETNTNNETTDATFTNAASDDYTLNTGSNGINEGYSSGSPALDLLGVTRDGLPDMGAYEFGAAAPLPIKLLSFKGESLNNLTNVLSWSTASEKNNNYFTVEKTKNGKEFYEVGRINGAGNSNHLNSYTLSDLNVEKVINYYRLIQTDLNGIKEYTKLISIDNRTDNIERYIIKKTNLLGQEVNEYYQGVMINLYSDGTTEKVIKITSL